MASRYDSKLPELNLEDRAGITFPIHDGRIQYTVPSCIGADCVTDVKYNGYTNRIIIKTDRGKKYTLRIKKNGSGIKEGIVKFS